MSKLSEEQYVGMQGLACPNCLSREIIAISEYDQSSPDIIVREISCTDCHHRWVDVYELVGYNNLEKMDNPHSS